MQGIHNHRHKKARLSMTNQSNKNINKPRREKGAGSITLRKDGTYMGRITLSGIVKTVYGKSEAEVKRKLTECRNGMIRGENIIKKIKVSDYIEQWMETYKKPSLKPSSYDRLERTYIHHVKNTTVGKSQMGNISTKDLQTLINTKSMVLSFSSLKKVYELLNSCLRSAKIAKDLNFNPMDGVILPKQSNMPIKTKKVAALTKDECTKLISVAQIKKENGDPIYRYSPAILLMLNCGMRAGELLALTWDNVDMDSKLIHICQNTCSVVNRKPNATTKTMRIITDVKTINGTRSIPLNNQAIATLEQIKEFYTRHKITSPYVICTDTGNMVSHRNFQTCLDRLLKKAGLNHVGTHSLRHTFASILIESDANIKAVSDLLGHGSTSITYNTYVHSHSSSLTKTVQALDSIYA